MIQIDILHKYDASRYYQPLFHGVDLNLFSSVNFYNYSILPNPWKITRNVPYLWNLWGSTGRTVLLGGEPFDLRAPLFSHVAERHNVIYHTSWPYWSGSDVPQAPRTSRQRGAWDSFLDKVHTVTVSDAAKGELSRMGYDATHIPHGVRTDVFTPGDDSGEGSGDEVTILFVGRFVEEKGIHDLLAVADSLDRGDVCFQFVGNGPLADDIKEAQTTSPVEHLGYIGDRDALAEVYAAADIFVLPSFRFNGWEELFGIVLIEAMAAGVPVVTTDCVGPREIVEDGETGYIVSQRSIPQLTTALERLIDDPFRREQFGTAARTEAVENYDMGRIAADWNEFFEEYYNE